MSVSIHIVEDEQPIITLVKYNLEKEGYKVSSSDNGNDGIEDIKKFMNEKRIIYDHNIDQKGYKWSGESKLKKIDDKFLPKYVLYNLQKYKEWID